MQRLPWREGRHAKFTLRGREGRHAKITLEGGKACKVYPPREERQEGKFTFEGGKADMQFAMRSHPRSALASLSFFQVWFASWQ